MPFKPLNLFGKLPRRSRARSRPLRFGSTIGNSIAGGLAARSSQNGAGRSSGSNGEINVIPVAGSDLRQGGSISLDGLVPSVSQDTLDMLASITPPTFAADSGGSTGNGWTERSATAAQSSSAASAANVANNAPASGSLASLDVSGTIGTQGYGQSTVTAASVQTNPSTGLEEVVVYGHRSPIVAPKPETHWYDPVVKAANLAVSFFKGRPDGDTYYSVPGGGFHSSPGIHNVGDLKREQFVFSGGGTYISGGRVYIYPPDRSVPAVSIPNNVGAKGVNTGDLSFHDYSVSTPSSLNGALAANAVGRGLAETPTPFSGNKPASPFGTPNNAGPLPTAGSVNMVKSYIVPSPDPSKYTDITINYTISGQHHLNEGYVERFGQIEPNGNITLRTYGGGNAWRQNMALRPFWDGAVNNVWTANQNRIILDAQRK